MSIVRIPSPDNKHIWYEVDLSEKPLGEGGMGKVYRGSRIDEITQDRRDVAVKFLFSDLPEDVMERAKTEASIQILSENLVEMLEFVQIDEVVGGKMYHRCHVISEYLHGVMLHDVINGVVSDIQGEFIPFAEEVYNLYKNDRESFITLIVKNVLSGLLALHDKGYVHRDIDPSNIMVTADRKIKIIDYGIIKVNDKNSQNGAHKTIVGKVMGKPAYGAPELVQGDVDKQNATTDLYSIGIMLYQFATGELPFTGDRESVINMQVNSKLPLKNIADSHLRKIIATATEKKQIKRYQTASEFRVEIDRFSKGKADKAKLAPLNIAQERSAQPKMKDNVENNNNNDKRKRLEKFLRYGIPSIVAIIVIVFGVKYFNDAQKDKEELLRQKQIQDRIAQIENKMHDSLDENDFGIDSILTSLDYNYKIKSVGAYIEDAKKMILNNSKTEEGVNLLNKIVESGYKSSSYAAYLLSRLYYEHEMSDVEISQMRLNTSIFITRDNLHAHKLNQQSTQLDSTCYQGLYELACDYYAGEYRTGLPDSQDMAKAQDLFTKGLKLAENNSDSLYVTRYCNRLKTMGVSIELFESNNID